MTNAIRIDHIGEQILISKSFAKVAMNPTSNAYKDLAEVISLHPNYKIVERSIKKSESKKTYQGLTYDYMREYIILHTTSEEEPAAVAEFDELRHIARCHSSSFSYPAIKKWFLDKYPEVANFGVYETVVKYKKAS